MRTLVGAMPMPFHQLAARALLFLFLTAGAATLFAIPYLSIDATEGLAVAAE
jgi:hypothetical protein